MKSAENLTKDKELELGALIQLKIIAEQEVAKGEPLTSERRSMIKEGQKAANSLVASNERLVHKIAHQFKKKMPLSPDHDELFAEGMVGLANALNKYDPVRDNKFSTVAHHWIYQAIARGVNKRYRLVRLPENRVQDYTNINKIQKEFDDSGLTAKEIQKIVADRLNINEAKVEEILNAAATHASLNKSIGDGTNDAKELHDYVEELNQTSSAEDEVLDSEMNIILDGALSKLDALETEIISSAFKLDLEGYPTKTATKIKDENSLTNSEYRKLHNSGLAKIKSHMDSYGVTFADFFKD